jgi:hypothetical protein
MESERFDRLIGSLGRVQSRRGALRIAAATFGLSGLKLLGLQETSARRHKKHKNRQGNGSPPASPPPSSGPTKSLREICTPGVDTCASGLACDSPTTRHTCSSTVEGVDDWCCVPPGGSCTECDCCGDYYCHFDDNNEPHCEPNPEG